jgi:RNA polymerase-binding protein DksA
MPDKGERSKVARSPSGLELEPLRARLEGERERLLEEIQAQEIEGKEHAGYANHMADDATEVFEQAKSFTLRQTLKGMLQQVEHALARMDEGTYGLCEVCGDPIDPARLEALPQATLCLHCQQHTEQGS